MDPDLDTGNGDAPDAARLYLGERGVFEKTFLEHGGEIDSRLSPPKISSRLALSHEHVARSWAEVKAVLWFKVWRS